VELLDGLAIKKQPLLSLEKGGFPNLAWLIRVEESTELRGHNRAHTYGTRTPPPCRN